MIQGSQGGCKTRPYYIRIARERFELPIFAGSRWRG